MANLLQLLNVVPPYRGFEEREAKGTQNRKQEGKIELNKVNHWEQIGF